MEYPNIITDIYEVFKDYYDESRVDLQYASNYDRYYIIIYWPEVEIKNEMDEAITIWKLYSKIVLLPNGSLADRPLFIRSEYNEIQWNSNYEHSHISSIHRENPSHWSDSCLGRGPLMYLYPKLRDLSSYYTDMNQWRLFAWYLDKYVHVESISGIPYHRINQVGNQGNNTILEELETDIFNHCYTRDTTDAKKESFFEIIKKVIITAIKKKIIKFSFYNGAYNLGMSVDELILKISNIFIDFYNNPKYNYFTDIPKEWLFRAGLLQDAYFVDGHLKLSNTSGTDLQSKVGTYLFTFKGRSITLQRNDAITTETSKVTILANGTVGFIIFYILKFININYGKQETEISKKRRIF